MVRLFTSWRTHDREKLIQPRVLYISAAVINYIYVLKSDTSDPLGTWSDYGNVVHDGMKIEGGPTFMLILIQLELIKSRIRCTRSQPSRWKEIPGVSARRYPEMN